MKKRIVRTNNVEIYKKFNMLKIFSEITLPEKYGLKYIRRIVRNIDSSGNSVVVTRKNDFFVIRRTKPLDFDIYFGGREW